MAWAGCHIPPSRAQILAKMMKLSDFRLFFLSFFLVKIRFVEESTIFLFLLLADMAITQFEKIAGQSGELPGLLNWKILVPGEIDSPTNLGSFSSSSSRSKNQTSYSLRRTFLGFFM